MTAREFKKELKALGATFAPAKGSHEKVFLNGRQSIIPSGHKGDIPKGTVQAIRKQLGI
jgi:mRNA interferase HicA